MPANHLYHPKLRFEPHCHMFIKFNKSLLDEKFWKTEYNNFQKKEKIDNESNEYELKMKTIDDWGKYILNKTKEITNILAEKFKGFNTLNLSLDNENIKKGEKMKKKMKKNLFKVSLFVMDSI